VSDKPRVEVVPIDSLQPDPGNANRGTERGSYMLNDSLTQRGAGRSILTTGDGVILAGNKTHEQAVQAGFTEVITVHTTGEQLVAVVRDDLQHGDPEARRLAIEDNRIGQASLEFDQAVLFEKGKEDDTIFEGLWRDDELEALFTDLVIIDDGELAQRHPDRRSPIGGGIVVGFGKFAGIVDGALVDRATEAIQSKYGDNPDQAMMQVCEALIRESISS